MFFKSSKPTVRKTKGNSGNPVNSRIPNILTKEYYLQRELRRIQARLKNKEHGRLNSTTY